MKILIAEDNHFCRCILGATLVDWGYEIQAVNDGKDAWRVLQQPDAPRMAVLDWMMPRLDGPEVCRRVRALKREQPTYIILLTVKEGKENVIAGLEAGADDYIRKPFDREELHARLKVGLRIVGLQSSLADRVEELERALSGAQKMEAIGRLAGGVAHDFNNLLTVIMACSEMMLSRTDLDEAQRTNLELIKHSGARGAALTRQLLTFSRKQVLRTELVQPTELLEGLKKMLSRLIGEDIELVTELAPSLHPVLADPTQLEQVLMNLVVNSRDAMPLGGRILLKAENAVLGEEDVIGHWPAQPGSYVVLSVKDTGCGMDEKTRQHLFEPFFTTKEPGKGTGLGLATVYGIVRQSKGFIQVDTKPGEGSEFRIYLPRTECLATAVQAPPAAERALGSETVLLVEDEDSVRSLARQILQGNNYTVLEACNGEEALRVSASWPQPIHLMLTDMVMPRVGGRQLAHQLTVQRPDMRVLYMSGYPDSDIPSQHPLDLSHHFLQKPFTSTALIHKVREVLDS